MADDTISLKEYIDLRVRNVDESVSIAYRSMEKRLAGMNEFRDTLKDQASKFVTRAEIEDKVETMQKQIDVLLISKATLEGKASQQSVVTALIISAIGIVLGLIGIISKFL